LSRLFISHSSKDNVAAVAFRQWLGAIGWLNEDVFLDLDSIGAGERWKDALNKANARCEAVILLASPEALSSPECIAEVRKAEDVGKEIIVVLLHDLKVEDHRLDAFKDRQIVDLAAPPQSHIERIDHRGERHQVRFNEAGLARVKDFLEKRGITPDHFAWPPQDKPNAEPFPGLSAFTQDDAGIFFGRDADIVRGLNKLRILRRNGRPRLLVIQAASGAGKSSYLRAGLWPRLVRDPDFAPLAILRPAQGMLTGLEGLGHKLAARLSRPGHPISPGEMHAQLMAPDAATAANDFASLLATASAQAHEQRRVGDREARAPALVVAVDQAEELFSADDKVQSDRFLILLASFMREPPTGVEIFCLFAIRSDGAAYLFQTIANLNLEVPDTLPLLAVPQTDYRDVILKPLEVLARRGQRLTLSPVLADRLVADATGADALPLLAFTISHLYREFGATGGLTLEQYERIGGVAGSIDMALKRALARPSDAPVIPTERAEQFATLRAAFIPWLARIDPNTGVPVRRVARLDEFPQHTHAVVERLIEARLLVADRRSGTDIVELAHESLLRQWPALAGWLEADGDDLRLLEGVERAAFEWIRNGQREEWLDHRGERLIAAERAASRDDFRSRYEKNGAAYLRACRAATLRRIGFLRRSAVLVASIIVVAATLLRAIDAPPAFELRQLAFNIYQRFHPRTSSNSAVTVVSIDEQSLGEIGQWPWPRTVLADLVQRLHQLGAAAIAFDMLFAEPDRSFSPFNFMSQLNALTDASNDPDTPIVKSWLARQPVAQVPDPDKVFAAAVQQSPVALGFFAGGGMSERPPPKADVAFIGADPLSRMPRLAGAILNLPTLDDAASGIGFINQGPHNSGSVERVPMLMSDGNRAYPSLVIEALRVAQHLQSIVVRTRPNGAVLELNVGGIRVPTSADGQMWLYYDRTGFSRYLSAKDVLKGADVRPRIAGRIVFIAPTAAGLGNVKISPLGEIVPDVDVLAQAADQIIAGAFLTRPIWASGFETFLTFVLGALVGLLILTLRSRLATLIIIAILVVMLGSSWLAFSLFGLVFDPIYPAITSICVFLWIAGALYFATESEKEIIRLTLAQRLASAWKSSAKLTRWLRALSPSVRHVSS
jgi:CHASE2 domain-containing sensor protein